jgi:hypothetical protein
MLLETLHRVKEHGVETPNTINFAVGTHGLRSHNSMIERRGLDQAVSLLLKVLPILDARKVKEKS